MIQATADTLNELEDAFAGIDTDDGASLNSHFKRDFDQGDVTVLTIGEIERVGRCIAELKALAEQNALVL